MMLNYYQADSSLIFDIYMQVSISIPYAFVWENA